MRLPIQKNRITAAASRAAAHTLSQAPAAGILPSSCCDGTVTIYSPQGQQLYQGSSGCCYDGGQAYCYPCGGAQEQWESYAKQHFAACQGTPTCSVALTGCGKLTPYC